MTKHALRAGIFPIKGLNAQTYARNENRLQGSVDGWGTTLQTRRSRVRVPMRWSFSIYLILQPHYGPWVDSASNRNEYPDSRNLPEGYWAAGEKCWQSYRHLWADCLDKIWEPRRLTTLWAFTACCRDNFYLVLWPSLSLLLLPEDLMTTTMSAVKKGEGVSHARTD
jgi:hypothetical protein